jgi:hypothetical protein
VIDVKQHAQCNGGRIVSPLNVLNNHHKTRFSSAKINNGWSYGCLTGNQLLEEFEDTKRRNQNPYIAEEQSTQWPKEKIQMDKQRSTKHTFKLKIEYHEPQG